MIYMFSYAVALKSRIESTMDYRKMYTLNRFVFTSHFVVEYEYEFMKKWKCGQSLTTTHT